MFERILTCCATAWVPVLSACLAMTGCSSSADAKSPTGGGDADGSTVPSDDDDAAAAASCQTGGLPTDTYAPNLKKIGHLASGNSQGDAGSSDALTFVLESNEVAGAASPPIEPYMNTFTLQLFDSSGQPVKDANVTLPTDSQALGWPSLYDPFMPLHGHGSSITPTVTNKPDGTYSISTYFQMAGLWQIYIAAQVGSVTDAAEYSFCLR